ncbi:unnamed protein product [Meloidogyne enterolobii]|uniref:Uncharacterized protein n=1 Tax=Meloidogyne enterolobii TaxID=390850 RepID=A0ACB1A542_MELEN
MRPTLCNLILDHIENSTACQINVDKTEFHYQNWPLFTISERAINVERRMVDRFNYVKYELANLHNSKIKFLVQWIYTEIAINEHAQGMGILQAYLAIERIKGQEIVSLLDYDLNKLFF